MGYPTGTSGSGELPALRVLGVDLPRLAAQLEVTQVAERLRESPVDEHRREVLRLHQGRDDLEWHARPVAQRLAHPGHALRHLAPVRLDVAVHVQERPAVTG